MFNKNVAACTVLMTALAYLPLKAQAQANLPVIVVFQDHVRFQDFSRFAAPDSREAANPQAWRYLDRGVLGAVRYLEQSRSFRADHVFSRALRGFSARLTAEQIQRLKTDSLVKLVEPDGVMTASDQTIPWNIADVGATVSSTIAGNGWGAVSNVNVYIIDTGVGDHADLNKVNHVNFAGGRNTDCNGHGTAVAGVAAAMDNSIAVVGVAPGAPITGVKVLGCNGSGSTSTIIKGVDWVTANAVRPAVANMSLGGKASDALDAAVQNSAAAGVFYVIAAGNSDVDACTISPARAGAGTNGILTVGATDQNNQAAVWSNYGSCVDIWAPGVYILTTALGGGTTTMAGTSLSSPHGAGAAAMYLSSAPSASPSAVEAIIKSVALRPGGLSNGPSPVPILLVWSGTF